MVLLSIDTGTAKSAVVAVDSVTYKIISAAKIDNAEVVKLVRSGYYDDLIIEGISSYGQPIGQETLDTVFFNGRLYQIALERDIVANIITRKDIKKHFEIPRGANADAFIRRTLIDRFAIFDMKNGKGTKKSPDWFAGVTADMWSAYAVACCWMDKQKEGINR